MHRVFTTVFILVLGTYRRRGPSKGPLRKAYNLLHLATWAALRPRYNSCSEFRVFKAGARSRAASMCPCVCLKKATRLTLRKSSRVPNEGEGEGSRVGLSAGACGPAPVGLRLCLCACPYACACACVPAPAPAPVWLRLCLRLCAGARACVPAPDCVLAFVLVPWSCSNGVPEATKNLREKKFFFSAAPSIFFTKDFVRGSPGLLKALRPCEAKLMRHGSH